LTRRIILLLIAALAALAIASSTLLIEHVRLNDELIMLKRDYGEYWYDSNWVTTFVGYNPITSAVQANETYLMLVDKAPRKAYWITYLPEDKGLPLRLEASEMDSYFKVNGTFRNYAVNCPDARLVIIYTVFKNGTATLENVRTICSGYEHQEYP
jgi:hypothetical protein